MPLTSLAKTSRGFTLLELLIVMSLIAAIVGIALPRLGGHNNQIRSIIRKLSTLSRELQSTAKLKGATYRLVVDLNKGEKGGGQSFWVEHSPQSVLSSSDLEAAEAERKSGTWDPEDNAPKAQFTRDERIFRKTQELPGDLVIEDVELTRLDHPLIEGKAFIHFYAQGLADEATIHLKAGEKTRWTLYIHPLTGKTQVIPSHVRLRELKE